MYVDKEPDPEPEQKKAILTIQPAKVELTEEFMRRLSYENTAAYEHLEKNPPQAVHIGTSPDLPGLMFIFPRMSAKDATEASFTFIQNAAGGTAASLFVECPPEDFKKLYKKPLYETYGT